ncbi:MAG: nitrate reductase associated protein [Prochloraceae cyanobacterium]
MSHFFEFESDFVDSLNCIPMTVRMKLDTCGVKLKLSHWNQLNETERQTLVTMPCTTEEESQGYRNYLQQKVTEKTGRPAGELAIDPHPPWTIEEKIPTEVSKKAAAERVEITKQQWSQLTNRQRFALIKLSRSNHENKNFLPALKEFNLI